MADPAPVTPTPAPAPPAAEPAPTPQAKPSLAGDPAVPAAPGASSEPPAEPAKPAQPAAGSDLFDAKAWKAPEGFTIAEPLMGKFAETMNSKDLSPQKRGEALLSLYTDAVKQVGEANTKAWTDVNDQWVKDVKADPEIGGDKLEPTRQMISKAIDTLGPEGAKAFREALDITGAGNNPAIVKALAKWSKALTEGGHFTGNPPAPQKGPKSFFDNSPQMFEQQPKG